jgi:hypothetical protein
LKKLEKTLLELDTQLAQTQQELVELQVAQAQQTQIVQSPTTLNK